MIWCTNFPNVHIYTFHKRWSFIWGCFFGEWVGFPKILPRSSVELIWKTVLQLETEFRLWSCYYPYRDFSLTSEEGRSQSFLRVRKTLLCLVFLIKSWIKRKMPWNKSWWRDILVGIFSTIICLCVSISTWMGQRLNGMEIRTDRSFKLHTLYWAMTYWWRHWVPNPGIPYSKQLMVSRYPYSLALWRFLIWAPALNGDLRYM